MKLIHYKNFQLEGKTPVSFSENEITVDFELTLDTHLVEDKLEVQRVKLAFSVSVQQAELLQQGYPDFPLAEGQVSFLAEPGGFNELVLTSQTDNRELIEKYRHILFDLKQYASWRHQRKIAR